MTWTLGYAHHLQGDRAAAREAYTEVISICQAIGHSVIAMMATLGLGNIQETENQLYPAAETYRRALKSAGEPPPPPLCDAYLGLARLYYQWNDLHAAEQHAQQCLLLARQIADTDRVVSCELFLAHLKLAQGDVTGAAAILERASHAARQHHFALQVPEIAVAQVLTSLRRGHPAAAAQLVETHKLPMSEARVQLAQGNPATALAVLGPLRQQVEAKGWQDERLKVMVLQAVALHAHGDKDKAGRTLGEALALAEPGGYVRIFVDEGALMAQLLPEAAARGMMPGYVGKLLAAFEAESQPVLANHRISPGKREGAYNLPPAPSAWDLPEPLSQRELEVLRLVAQGLSNREISKRLFRALSTVKGHNLMIFDKLQVKSRTEAVARARELGLL